MSVRTASSSTTKPSCEGRGGGLPPGAPVASVVGAGNRGASAWRAPSGFRIGVRGPTYWKVSPRRRLLVNGAEASGNTCGSRRASRVRNHFTRTVEALSFAKPPSRQAAKPRDSRARGGPRRHRRYGGAGRIRAAAGRRRGRPGKLEPDKTLSTARCSLDNVGRFGARARRRPRGAGIGRGGRTRVPARRRIPPKSGAGGVRRLGGPFSPGRRAALPARAALAPPLRRGPRRRPASRPC